MKTAKIYDNSPYTVPLTISMKFIQRGYREGPSKVTKIVNRGKLENPEKISSEQGPEPTTLKHKALMALGPGFDPGHIGARQALSPLRHHNLCHDLSQNTRLVIRA